MATASLNATFHKPLVERYKCLDTAKDWSWGSNGAWMQFIFEIMDGDIEMCRFMQVLFGYALQGDLNAQVLAFFIGGGCNGKSVCLETMLKVFGGYGKATTNNMFITKYGTNDNAVYSELAQLLGKRYIVADEIQEGIKLNEASVKNLTTGQEVIAKFFHKDVFTYKPQFTSFLQGNHKPTIQGDDVGIWRRILLVPFDVDFTNRMDNQLAHKLNCPEVFSSIMAWCVAGNAIYRQEGLIVPSKARVAKDEYKRNMNYIQAFIDDCLEVMVNDKVSMVNEGKGKDGIEMDILYRVYEAWSKANFQDMDHRNIFGRKLSEKGIKQHKTTNKRFYKVNVKDAWKDACNAGNIGQGKLELLLGKKKPA